MQFHWRILHRIQGIGILENYRKFTSATMKARKTKGILPLSFVQDKLQQPLQDTEDFLDRMQVHVEEQITALQDAQLRHSLPSLKPLAESVQNGLNIMDFHLADAELSQIQQKSSRMEDDEELQVLITRVVAQWNTFKENKSAQS